VYVLLSTHLASDQDPFRLIEMPLRSENAEMQALNEIKFLLVGSDNGGNISLSLGDDVELQPVNQELLPANFSFGEIIAIPFALEQLPFGSLLNSPEVELNIDLLLHLPGQSAECNVDTNIVPYSLTLRIGAGDARQMPSLYGDVNEYISPETINAIRLEILTDTLLRPFTATTTS
jgi:hypothetical protein